MEEVQLLKNLIDNGVNFENIIKNEHIKEKSHTICGLLKQYTRELPESIFPQDIIEKMISKTHIEDKEERIKLYKEILEDLPKENYIIISRWMILFQKIIKKPKLLMNSENLATVFSMNFVHLEEDPLKMVKKSSVVNKIFSFIFYNSIEIFPETFKDVIFEEVEIKEKEVNEEKETCEDLEIENTKRYKEIFVKLKKLNEENEINSSEYKDEKMRLINIFKLMKSKYDDYEDIVENIEIEKLSHTINEISNDKKKLEIKLTTMVY
jgi:hypothetical protein